MNLKRDDGFTLVELLVASAIGLIVMSSVYTMYRTQQKSYILQEQVAGMQQNLRAALFYMAREIRMAGCDPTTTTMAGITTHEDGAFAFTCDIRGDALGSEFDGDIDDPNERITYTLVDGNIERNDVILAENIDALDFRYLDANGNETSTVSEMKSVIITIVARTGRGDQGYTNNDGEFRNPLNILIYTADADPYHRRMLSTQVRMRNL